MRLSDSLHTFFQSKQLMSRTQKQQSNYCIIASFIGKIYCLKAESRHPKRHWLSAIKNTLIKECKTCNVASYTSGYKCFINIFWL